MSNFLQHARLSCPSLSPRVSSNACPLSQYCYSTISFLWVSVHTTRFTASLLPSHPQHLIVFSRLLKASLPWHRPCPLLLTQPRGFLPPLWPLMPSLCLALSMSSHLLVVCLWSLFAPEKSLEPWSYTSCFFPQVSVHCSTHIWIECYHFGFQFLDHCEFWWQGPKQSGQRRKPTLESDWPALLLPAPWRGASFITTQNLSFFFYTPYVFRTHVFRFKKISEVDEVGF